MGLFSGNGKEDITQQLADKLRDLRKRCSEVDDRAERIRQDKTAPAYLELYAARHTGATPGVIADLTRKVDEARYAQEAERDLHIKAIQQTGEELKVRNQKARMESITTLESKIKELDDRRFYREDTGDRDDRPDPPRFAVHNNADAIRAAKNILMDGKFKIRGMVEASVPEISEFLIDVLTRADNVPLEPQRELLTESQAADIRPRPPEDKKLQPGWRLPSGGVITSKGVVDDKTHVNQLWDKYDQIKKEMGAGR